MKNNRFFFQYFVIAMVLCSTGRFSAFSQPADGNYTRTLAGRSLPDYFDGPYAHYQGKHKIKLFYIKHDSLKNRTKSYSFIYNLKTTRGWVHGFMGDTTSYFIKSSFQPEASIISDAERIFVIGDIHGQCDTLKKFLINNQVTDQNLRWRFGKGHIVFLGDIFDRGESVTEALWLIYRLEHEAALAGGGVHLILGNHEIMTLSGDMRNLSEISDKYYFLFDNLKRDYYKAYSNETVLGRWLRSKNTFLKINNLLFVHGGIHPELINYRVSIDSVNHTINQYLTGKQKKSIHHPLLSFLLGIDGPFWYRGMIPGENHLSLAENDINQILSYFNVSAVMVGHTTLPQITSYFSDKVYGLDVPFYRNPGKPMEAIYIEPSIYYRVFSNGLKEKFK